VNSVPSVRRSLGEVGSVVKISVLENESTFGKRYIYSWWFTTPRIGRVCLRDANAISKKHPASVSHGHRRIPIRRSMP